MDLFDNLASFGLTPRLLQILIIIGIGVFLVGLFWRYIVIGSAVLFCVMVFAMPTKTVDVVKNVSANQELNNRVEVDPPVVAEIKPKSDEEMFLEDCQLQTKYTLSQCKALWNEHKDEIEAVKYRGKNKKNQMMKVKYGT